MAHRPLTRMAADAIKGKAGNDMNGYRDYRGVPVYGAWLWNNKLGVGIATEIDVKEALGGYRATRWTMIGILGVTLALTVGAFLFTLVLGERTTQTLEMERDKLEERIKERTAEIAEQAERTRLALEGGNLGSWDVTFPENKTTVNHRWAEMLDYKLEEVEKDARETWIRHLHPEDRERVLDVGQTSRYEKEFYSV